MSIVACVSGTANVTASSRIKPKTTETKTDVHMPVAAILDALARLLGRVRRRIEPGDRVLRHQEPEPKTNQNAGLENDGRSTPVARVVHGLREDVRERLMLSGTMMRMPTTSTTPTMCQ